VDKTLQAFPSAKDGVLRVTVNPAGVCFRFPPTFIDSLWFFYPRTPGGFLAQNHMLKDIARPPLNSFQRDASPDQQNIVHFCPVISASPMAATSPTFFFTSFCLSFLFPQKSLRVFFFKSGLRAHLLHKFFCCKRARRCEALND